jgi:hypothetical protein
MCLFVALIVGSLVLGPTRLIAQSASVVEQDGDRVRTYPSDSREVRIGFRIAPVRLTFKPADRELVGRGSYLVNAQGGCNDCHTRDPYLPGGDPFRGEPEKINPDTYLGGGVSFGPFRSRNITPNADGLPAGISWADFKFTMTTGFDLYREHPQISPYLQVMPWPVYRNMKTSDLRAIYAFLKAIPSVPTPAATTP